MTRRPSLKHQVEEVLRGLFTEHASRQQAKQKGTDHQHIFSYTTLDTYRERCLTLLNALDNHRPRWLRDLTPELIERGIGTLRARGAGDAHIKTTLAAFRKLGEGLQQRQWIALTPAELVPNRLYDDLERPAARGGYSEAQIAQLRATLSSRSRGDDLIQMFDLINASGLRHNEIARLREMDIDQTSVTIRVTRTNAKGGRERIVGPGLDEQSRAELHAAISAIPPGRNWLWTDGPALARRLQDAIREACGQLGIEPKGIHGLRGSFAERFLTRRLATGLDERSARLDLSRQLGHNRVDVTYRYVPPLS